MLDYDDYWGDDEYDWDQRRSTEEWTGPRKNKLQKKELIEAAKSLLEDLLPEYDSEDSLNNFGWINEYGQCISYPDQPCYRMLDEAAFHVREAVYFVDYACSRDANFDECSNYVHHILNHSPYSEVFVTKDPKEWHKIGTICDVNYPTKLIIQGLTCLRYCFEYRNYVRTWNQLVEDGMDKDLAIIAMQFLYKTGSVYEVTGGPGGGHDWYTDYTFRLHHLNNFLSRNYSWELARNGIMKSCLSYQPTSAAWEDDDYHYYRRDRTRQELSPSVIDTLPFRKKKTIENAWGRKIQTNGVSEDDIPKVFPTMKEKGYIV